jgi:alpha-glucuronidase
LDRARKWSQLLVECEIILSDKNQTEVDFDRIYDMKSEIERMKALDEFELIKQVREQFALLDEWHLELDKVTESDENGRVLSSDRELLESLVKKARNEFKINISKEIDEIVSQVKDVEAWEDATRKLIESDQLSKIDEARNLLKTVRDDKEENYNIID